MIKLTETAVCYSGGKLAPAAAGDKPGSGTMAQAILDKHNYTKEAGQLKLKFDVLTSHDITFVSVIQTAKASGLQRFPVPYVLTNCHNSLCAVGGTINEDDHRFGLSAAKKYGGVFVPPHIAVIHQYMREQYAGCGRMILGTDSHTRYGALGTLAIGEGGGEMVKQLLEKTYDMVQPDIVCVHLSGTPQPGVGPQDVALAIIGATFGNGFVNNKVMEFVGSGIKNLSQDFRNGIDVMTTETSCLSSIWETDAATEAWLATHGRAADYAPLHPAEKAVYSSLIEVDLSQIRPMIALPFHPSNVFAIEELQQNAADILRQVELDAVETIGCELDLVSKLRGGKIHVDQGVIAGCAGGTYENIYKAASMLKDSAIGSGEFALSVYPASQAVNMQLVKDGSIARLIGSGAVMRSCFCGPCFGAGDVPFNNGLSIRHTTRNFPWREGARPADGQVASVALMDALSIAATAKAGGVLTPATECPPTEQVPAYQYDGAVYASRVYQGFGKAEPKTELSYGPNIKDWPELSALQPHLLLQVASLIMDPVTTTDELIPSGETSSYRSNPLRLAEATLSRKDPAYVGRAKQVLALEQQRAAGAMPEAVSAQIAEAKQLVPELSAGDIGLGSLIYAVKPGDGSAREQAASCQRVLGGVANIAHEYATKRYRSNLLNWGMLPFTMQAEPQFAVGDWLLVPNIREAVQQGKQSIEAFVLGKNPHKLELNLLQLTEDEKRVLLAGCLMNDYRSSLN